MNFRWTRSLSQSLVLFGIIGSFTSRIAAASTPAVVADGQIVLASGFQMPEGVAVSKSGTVYVADTANNRVVTVSSAGVVTAVNVPGYTLSGPAAVAVDSSGDLFIADSNNSRVLELKANSSVVQVAGSQTLSYPASLAFDPAGDLYIGDSVHLAVYKVSASVLAMGGGTVTTVNIANVSNLFPGALACDGAGDLYIADGNSNNIYELPAGQTLAQNVTPGGFKLSSPSGLGFDAAGDLFVLDSGNARLIEAPHPAGSTPYMVPVTGLAVPSSLALDPQGNLYITDVTNNNLTQLIYAGNPVYLGQIAVGSAGTAATINYELNAPETLTAFQVTMQGDIAAEASIAAGTTCQFQSYADSPVGSSNPISPTNPFDCVAELQGDPAYPGTRNGAINLLGSSSTLLVSVPFRETGVASAAWIAPGVASTAVSGFTQPQGLAVSAENGVVYVADFAGGKVYSWKGLNGTNSPLTTVSTAPVALSAPAAVALDAAGDLFIADEVLGKIVVVPANTAITPYSLATGSVLEHPIALTIDASGNLYIGDAGPAGIDGGSSSMPGFVVKVPPSGGPISVLSTSAANLIFPESLAADAAGNLYIGDGGGSSGNGQLLLVPQGQTSASVMDIPGLIDPAGLAVDPAGDLWILDAENLTQFTIVPPVGGTPYTVPLAAPILSNPSAMAFTAGSRNLLIPDIGHGSANELVLVSGSQAQLAFPQTAVGSQSAAQAASIVSIGNTALQPANSGGNLYSVGGNTQDFQLQNTSTCLSFTQLLPSGSCTFSAIFAPLTAGAESESVTSIFNSLTQVQLLLSGVTPNSSSVAASPTISPGSGTYSTVQTVTISDTTSGAVIYYTTNGTTPTTSSTVYHTAISVSAPETINAIAVASGYTNSPVASAVYSFPTTAEPIITLATGIYVMPTNTTITDSTSGASILWCYVGSGTCTPATAYTTGESIYVDPTATETICANATASAHALSATACNNYTNGTAAATPVITLAAGNYPTATSTTITDSTSGATILWCSVASGTCTPATSYSGSINITTAVTICANATASGHAQSAKTCSSYTIGTPTATPSITLATGTYVMPTNTTITDSTSGASILWCYVGTGTCTPATAYTTGESIYIDPTATETICANATASGDAQSATACHTYTNSN